MKVTSRERSSKIQATLRRYLDLAQNKKDIVWLLSLDDDDSELDHYISCANNLFSGHEYYLRIGRSASKIDAINRDINTLPSNWDILLNISDDQIPVESGYDKVIRDAMPDDLDYSLWFNDGRQCHINTQEIVGRKYYERFSYIYYGEYKSFFCDNESTEVAGMLGRQKKMNMCLIRHDHPGWDHLVSSDNLYVKNQLHWEHDQQLFSKRARSKFGFFQN